MEEFISNLYSQPQNTLPREQNFEQKQQKKEFLQKKKKFRFQLQCCKCEVENEKK